MGTWTEEQQRIIRRGVGSTVVVAAPGSGKTTVLTEHIVNVVKRERVPPSAIMAVTFTRQAAEHMREKLRSHNDLTWRTAESLRIGTFHAQLFRAVLQVNADIPLLLQPQEQRAIMAEAVAQVCRSQTVTNTMATHYLTMYSKSVGMCKAPDSKVSRKVIREYNRIKKRINRWDYDDVLVQAVDVLKECATDGLFSSLEYLLIDEFQDTNALQWSFIQLIHERCCLPVFVVGDDDQAIYAFRGASPEFLQRAATELVNAQQMLLTRNFRSDFKIVSHASEMLAFMTDRVDKPLCAVSPAAGYCAGLVFASAEAGSSGFIGIVERICRDRPSTTVGILARTRAQLYPIWSAIKRCDFAGGVELRTYHESKGKEWDVVLLMNSVEEQRGLSEVDEEDAERRLHYVALTRAKHVLIIVLYGPQREPLNRFFVEAGLTAESWSDEKLTDILLALERTS